MSGACSWGFRHQTLARGPVSTRPRHETLSEPHTTPVSSPWAETRQHRPAALPRGSGEVAHGVGEPGARAGLGLAACVMRQGRIRSPPHPRLSPQPRQLPQPEGDPEWLPAAL